MVGAGATGMGKRTNKQVGRLLKAARCKKKMTIEAVATELRIPPRQLQALEGGDVSVFPAEVYARGAYIKYARYLGVDEKTSYHAFLRSLSGAHRRVSLRPLAPRKWINRSFTSYGVFVVLVVAVILAVTSYIGLQVQSFVRLPKLEIIEPASAVIKARQVLVRGIAQKDAKVAVNGEAVLLHDDGTFEMVMPLSTGINVIQAEVTGAAGRMSIVRKDVLVPRD